MTTPIKLALAVQNFQSHETALVLAPDVICEILPAYGCLYAFLGM
ncbi:hypothetical protein [Cognatishimia activa]|nr:hypothetical protein [Cognatishimia activa]